MRDDLMLILVSVAIVAMTVRGKIGQVDGIGEREPPVIEEPQEPETPETPQPVVPLEYVHMRGLRIVGPKPLPSVGIRQDTGDLVLGLHGADEATQRACGWYAVVPSVQRASEGQKVIGRSFELRDGEVHEVLQFGEVVEVSAADRVAAIFDALPGNDDERVSAFVQLCAQVVTNKLQEAVTVTIPAKIGRQP